jgi:hypothetical protein
MAISPDFARDLQKKYAAKLKRNSLYHNELRDARGAPFQHRG